MSSLSSISGNGGVGAAPKRSKIEQDLDRLVSLTKEIRGVNNRVVRHAVYLGYYTPPPTMQAPNTLNTSEGNPKVDNLSNAIHDLDNAINELNLTLNAFD